jgi:hypothetical protein
MTQTELQAWSDDAAQAGDAETMLIAERAMGIVPNQPEYYALPAARVRRIAKMTQRGAARIAATWGSPFSETLSEEDGY